MKISSDILKEKLKYISFGISKNSTDPARTKAIKFLNIDHIVYAFANDGINQIKVEIGPDDSDFNAVVDYNQFNNIIKACEGEISLNIDKKGISIKTTTMKAKIPTYSANIDPSKENSVFSKNISMNKSLSNDLHIGLIKLIVDTTHAVEAYRKVYFGNNLMVSDTDNVLIIKEQIFDKDIMLNFSSIELLSNISEVKYTYLEGKITKLYVSSKELEATIIIDLNEDGDFQYDDLMALFADITGSAVEINTKILSKAMSTSQLFKKDPVLVFNNTGISLNIDSVEFSYKISDTCCEDRAFILTPDVARKVVAIGDTIILYYTNEGLIRCDSENTSEILSVKEVSENG